MTFAHCMMVIMLCVVMPQVIEAAKIYQWKDASGIMHFTDSEFNVPAEYRAKSARELSALPVVDSPSGNDGKAVLDGKILYEKKCAECHVLGFENKGRREGLAWAVIDDNTKYPRPLSELFDKLRGVVDGSIDMPVMDINDEDLMAITKYLIEAEGKTN